MYIYYVYINANTCMFRFKKSVVYILNIFLYNINIYMFIHVNIFKTYTVCVYLYIHYKYTQYIYIYYVNNFFLFWMRLIAINNLTALIYKWNCHFCCSDFLNLTFYIINDICIYIYIYIYNCSPFHSKIMKMSCCEALDVTCNSWGTLSAGIVTIWLYLAEVSCSLA